MDKGNIRVQAVIDSRQSLQTRQWELREANVRLQAAKHDVATAEASVSVAKFVVQSMEDLAVKIGAMTMGEVRDMNAFVERVEDADVPSIHGLRGECART